MLRNALWFTEYCSETVEFAPTGAGLRTAKLTVGSDGSYIPLYGYGLSSAPGTSVTVSPTTVIFRDMALPQQITLSNYLTSAVTITSITMPNQFTQTNNCGTSLAAQSICTITVTSTRVYSGGSQGLMTVNGSFGTLHVDLTNLVDPIFYYGSGTEFNAASPTTQNIPATFSINVTGTGGNPFTFSGSCSIVTTGICYVPVYYTAYGFGVTTAQMTETFSLGTTITPIYMVETVGVNPNNPLTLSPSSFTMPVLGVTQTESTTVTNTGSATVNLVTPPTFIGAYAPGLSLNSYTCGVLTAGASCTFSMNILQSIGGTYFTYIVFTDSISGQTFPVSFGYSGDYGYPTISPTGTIAFPATAVNSVSSPQSVTVTTLGNHAVTAALYTAPNSFVLTKSSCAAGESPCLITAVFAPTSVVSGTGQITVTDVAYQLSTNFTVSYSSFGTGIAGISPTSVSFPSRASGTTSIPTSLTLSNTGSASFAVSSISFSGTNASEFTTTNTCGGSVAVSGSCTINVSFAPVSAGSKSASLVISGTTAAGLPLSVPITGTAY